MPIAYLFISCLVLAGGSLPQAATTAQDDPPRAEIQDLEPIETGGILVVDHRVEPRVSVRWVTSRGPVSHGATLPYSAPVGGEPVAPNIMIYASVGGTRIETGDGHPKGLVVRAGLTKIDNTKPFFDDPEPGTMIEIRMENVRVNEPVKAHEGTGLVHLKYALGDLEACSIPGTARNQYLLEDPRDTLGGRVIEGENATPGALAGGDESDHNGDITVTIDEDDPTMLDVAVRFPFGMLRHLLDPWDSELPNTFFEPIHLHAEVELLPIDATPRAAPTVPDPED